LCFSDPFSLQPKYLSYSISLYITETTIFKYPTQLFSVYKKQFFTCGFIIYSYNIDGFVKILKSLFLRACFCFATLFNLITTDALQNKFKLEIKE